VDLFGSFIFYERICIMGSTKFSRPKSWRKGYVPQIEVLQSRITPSVTTGFEEASGTLTITGDELANAVDVQVVGTTATVSWDEISAETGETTTVTEEHENVQVINVDLQDGDDEATIDITDNEDLTVNIDMPGATAPGGDDAEGGEGAPGEDDEECDDDGEPEPEPAPPGTLGNGDDTYNITATEINKDTTLNVNVGADPLEDGDDTLTGTIGQMEQNATLNFNANLGGGDNDASLSVESMGRNATLNANVVAATGDSLTGAGAGADNVDMTVGEIGRDASVTLGASLGAGSDDFIVNTGRVGRDATVAVNADVGLEGPEEGDFFDADTVEIGMGLIGRGADVSLGVTQGADDDNLLVALDGSDRDVNLDVDLSTGGDDDNAIVELGDIGRDSVVTATTDLGDGDNELAMSVGDIGRDSDLSTIINGGAGFDTVALDIGAIGRGVGLIAGGDLGAQDDLLDFSLTGDVSTLETEIAIDFIGGDGEEDVANIDLGDAGDDLDPNFEGFEEMPEPVVV